MSSPNIPYVDLQVNGYHGTDFNGDDLTAESLHTACKQLDSDGVASILATIVTETIERMTTRLARLVSLREEDSLAKRLIRGIHIEGPFIELWAWDGSDKQLVDRSDSPWDDAERRPSHANRRKALRAQILRNELRAITTMGSLPRKLNYHPLKQVGLKVS